MERHRSVARNRRLSLIIQLSHIFLRVFYPHPPFPLDRLYNHPLCSLSVLRITIRVADTPTPGFIGPALFQLFSGRRNAQEPLDVLARAFLAFLSNEL